MDTRTASTGRPYQRQTMALATAAAIAVLLLPGVAKAATFGAAELGYDDALLSQFNLVNLGNFSSSAGSIAGRSVIGGNAALNATSVCTSTTACGNTTKAIDATTASTGYGALTVFGSISGGATVGASQATGIPPAGTGGDLDVKGNADAKTYNLNNAGGVNLGGTSQPTTIATQITEYRTVQATPPSGPGSSIGSNYNPANSGTGYTLAQVFAPFGNANTLLDTFTNPLKNLSVGLAALPGTPGVTAQSLPANSTSPFTAGSDYVLNGKSYGVVTTTLANFIAEGTKFGGVADGSNKATVVIITGDIANALLPTLGVGDSNVIYDFVNATSLTIGAAFDGTILAPLASLTQTSVNGMIAGTVVVASMSQMAQLATGNAFTGDMTGLSGLGYTSRVDEPASILLLGLGVCAVGALSLRRRAKSMSDSRAKTA